MGVSLWVFSGSVCCMGGGLYRSSFLLESHLRIAGFFDADGDLGITRSYSASAYFTAAFHFIGLRRFLRFFSGFLIGRDDSVFAG